MLHLDLTIGLVFVKFIFDNSQLWSPPIFNTCVFFFSAFTFFSDVLLTF